MSEIIVQRFEYLKGAMDIGGGINPYFGSATINQNTNILDDKFNYCVRIVKLEDESFVIRAEYALTYKALSVAEKEKIVHRDFDFSEDGRLEAVKFLEEEYEKACR